MIHFTLSSIPKVASASTKWLLNFPAQNQTIRSEFYDDSYYLPSFVSFVRRDACVNEITIQEFSIKYELVIVQLATGEVFFELTHLDAMHFNYFPQESWIDMPHAT